MEWFFDLISSVPDSPGALLDFVTRLLLSYGYLVIFLGAALDNYGLPASGDVVMFAGGWLANSSGRLEFPLIVASGFLGATFSDNSIYWLGRFGGRPLLEHIFRFRVLSLLLDVKSLGKVERYFEAHGGKTVLLGRFGPGLRSMTPLFAGVSRMKYYQFLPYSLAATATWSLTAGTVGYLFGQYWEELLAVARSAGFGVIALVAFVLLFYVYRRRTRRKARREADREAREEARGKPEEPE